jgi:hypothetical protein
MDMNKVLENIRSEKGNKCKGEQMDICKLLEFSGETPDGEGRAWYGGED